MPVIEYHRPLPPGTVRITRSEVDARAVTITIAPDTAKRTLFTLTRPLIVAAIFSLIPLALLDNSQLRAVGIAVLIAIGAAASFSCYRIVARSNQPIIFRADPAGIQIINPLDEPASQFHAADEIQALQLRRISLLSEPVCYQLELQVRAFTRDRDKRSLLVSQSAETLDKIGRTLCEALPLTPPVGSPTAWWSQRLDAANVSPRVSLETAC
jgi:hypothetical protein